MFLTETGLPSTDTNDDHADENHDVPFDDCIGKEKPEWMELDDCEIDLDPNDVPDADLLDESDQSSDDPQDTVRAYSIRIRPDKNAQVCLRHIMASVNRTHNNTVRTLKNCTRKQIKTTIRNQIVPKNRLTEKDKWLGDTPAAPRTNKVFQLVTAFNSNITKHGREGFDMHFKSWKKETKFSVECDGWQPNGRKKFFSSIERCVHRTGTTSRIHGYFNFSPRTAKRPDGTKIPRGSLKIPFADSPWVFNMLQEQGLRKAFVLKWEKPLNRWYIVVRFSVPVQNGPINIVRNAISLDPGVNNFMSLYETTGACYRIGGTAYKEYMEKKLQRVDTLVSRRDQLKNKFKNAKQRYKEARGQGTFTEHWKLLRTDIRHIGIKLRISAYQLHAATKRVTNWTKTMHGNVRSFLYSRYDTILLPRFKTSDMIPNLNSKVARNMATFSFYRFNSLMESKSKEDPNFQVFITDEPGTSKTCPLCSHVQNVNGLNVIKCNSCDCVMGRDVPRGACGNMQCYVVQPTFDDIQKTIGLI